VAIFSHLKLAVTYVRIAMSDEARAVHVAVNGVCSARERSPHEFARATA